MTDLSKTLIQNFIDAEYRHIDRYMCRQEGCPCSPRVDSLNYGTRANEFKDLSNLGTVTQYYADCYSTLPADAKFGNSFLTILETMENKHNCQGICNTTLFYFFRTAVKGPPEGKCTSYIIEFFKQELEPIGYYGVINGTLMGFYFLVQLQLWTQYTTEVV